MLKGLDTVDWKAYEHAYGTAEDTRDFLRDLVSPDGSRWQYALDQLGMSICHQGSCYSATPLAVRFLGEILESPYSARLEGVLKLLTTCEAGAFFSPAAGPHNAAGPPWPVAVEALPADDEGEPSGDEGERRADEAEPQADEGPGDGGDGVNLVEAIDAAAAAAIPAAKRLLAHFRAPVRAAAAHFLACFRTLAKEHGLIEAITARLAREGEFVARMSLVFALAHLLPLDEDDSALVAALEDPEPAVALVAAIMLVHRHGESAPSAVLAPLGRALERPGLYRPAYLAAPWSSSLVTDVQGALHRLGSDVTASVRPATLASLAKAGLPLDMPELFAYESAFGELHEGGLGSIFTAHHKIIFGGIEAAMVRLLELEARAPGHPVVAAAFAAVGDTLLNTGDGEYALAFYEQAVRVDPTHGPAHLHRGVILHDHGDFAAAEQAFALAAEHMDDPRHALQNRKRSLWRLGRHDEALAVLEVLQGGPPRTAEHWYDLGNALVKAGRHAETIGALTKVLEEYPDHADAHYALACAHALTGATDAALSHVEAAIANDPDLRGPIASDPDFKSIQDNDRFRALTSAAPVA